MPKQTYYITTAIDYPNAKPHIGHAYEKIVADMLARWHKLCGEDVFWLTGTDEHGQKIEKAAKAEGKTPKKFVDEQVKFFLEMYEKLNLKYNKFIRTTEKRHVKTAQEIFTKVFNKGLIYKGTYSGLYCTSCEAFYTEKDLQNGICPLHQRPAEKVSEESYFFKLSQFQEKIVQHITQNPNFIEPAAKRNEILNRLKEPLQDLSVSRDSFSWGVQVPQDKKHVIYVWFDALVNYLSGIAYPTKKFQKYWPAKCQLIGKDIAWFHTVIWPAILFASDLPLPKTVCCHGFLTVNGQKMSKTIGNVIDPIEIAQKYGADPVRYVLLREVPAGDDGDFSEENLIKRNNADLADTLGNLLQRTLVLIHKNFHGNIPLCGKITEKEKELQDSIPNIQEIGELIEKYQWHHAVEKIWNYINKCNKYVNDTAPWKQTNNPERLATILYNLVEHLRIISILIWPIIPQSAEKIASQIGQPIGKFKDVKFKKTTTGTISEPQILFEKKEIIATEQDPFSKLNLKVAIIEDVQLHPSADKLYVVKLNIGSEKRQIVAGMRPFYTQNELKGKHIVIVSNLKPANLRGVESQGMLLAAEKDGVVRVLEAKNASSGEQVAIDGIIPEKTEIEIDTFQKIKLTTKNKCATYKDHQLKTKSGAVEVDIADGAKIR